MNGHRVKVRNRNGVPEVFNQLVEYDVNLDKEAKEVEICIDNDCCCPGIVVLNVENLDDLISTLQQMKKELQDQSD